MTNIKKYFFWSIFTIQTIILHILSTPIALFYRKFSFIAIRTWGQITLILLKYICNINFILEGEENIPKDTNFLIISKHQSAWETIVFSAIFYKPVFVMKKEIMKNLILGFHTRSAKFIILDRSDKISAIKQITKEAIDTINKKHSIIIFPEGTRVSLNEKSEYKPGCYQIYKELYKKNIPSVPVALNSGVFMPKKGKFRSGAITVRILPPVPADLKKKEFLQYIEDVIEKNSLELAEQELK